MKHRAAVIALGAGALVIVSIAGFPAPESKHSERTGPPRPYDRSAYVWSAAFHSMFRDVQVAVDEETRQRPVYPSTDALAERLATLDRWERAALFEVDATDSELRASGLDPDELLARTFGSADDPTGLLRNWYLVALDADGHRLGLTRLCAFEPWVDRTVFGGPEDVGPTLDGRFPDWPRVAVFNRPPAASAH